MPKFILKLSIFLLPFFILTVMTEYKARSIPSDYSKKRLIADTKIESVDTIILGASHAYYGINTTMLDSPSLNLAYISQDIYYDNQILLNYLPSARKLKKVIISLSYPSLEGNIENSVESWRTSYYKQFWQIPARSLLPKLSDYSFLALFGVQASREYLIESKLPKTELLDDFGNPTNPRLTNAELKQSADKTINYHESAMRSDSITTNTKYLTEIIEALHRRQVKIIIITTPCLPNYYENINAQKYSEMQNIIKEFAQRYDIKYYNYLHNKSFNEDDFYDADHLNTQGSEKFTRILMQDITNLQK